MAKKYPKHPGIWRLKTEAFEALEDRKNAKACRQRESNPHS